MHREHSSYFFNVKLSVRGTIERSAEPWYLIRKMSIWHFGILLWLLRLLQQSGGLPQNRPAFPQSQAISPSSNQVNLTNNTSNTVLFETQLYWGYNFFVNLYPHAQLLLVHAEFSRSPTRYQPEKLEPYLRYITLSFLAPNANYYNIELNFERMTDWTIYRLSVPPTYGPAFRLDDYHLSLDSAAERIKAVAGIPGPWDGVSIVRAEHGSDFDLFELVYRFLQFSGSASHLMCHVGTHHHRVICSQHYSEPSTLALSPSPTPIPIP